MSAEGVAGEGRSNPVAFPPLPEYRAPGVASGPQKPPATGVGRREIEPIFGRSDAPRASDDEQMQRIVDQLNDVLRAVNHKIRFRVSAENRIQVQVIDAETQEVIKTIPSDRARHLGAALDELVGLIVDETR